MTAPAPPPIQQWLDRLKAAQPADVLERLAALEAQQTTSTVALAALVQMITNLEVRMSAADDKVAELTANLDNVTGDVQWLKDEAQRLQDEIAAQDPALAAKLQPLVDRTKALADSVPDRPAPGDGGGEPTPEPVPGDGSGDVVNPTVDADGNPIV